MIVALSAGSALAADQTYLAARAGIFLPNGRDGGNYKGFKYFDTGYNVDIAAGYRPASYAALELGSGFYTASGKVSIPGPITIDRTAYGVPITLTVKGVQEFDRLRLSAGGGVGLYQGFINNKITGITPSVEESAHGMAVGYQAVADVDFKLSDSWSAGAYFKWFSARPEIEMQNISTDRTRTETTKDKWEIGGTVVNIGVTYSY